MNDLIEVTMLSGRVRARNKFSLRKEKVIYTLKSAWSNSFKV